MKVPPIQLLAGRVPLLLLFAIATVSPITAMLSEYSSQHKLLRHMSSPLNLLQLETSLASKKMVKLEKMSAGWDEAYHACALQGRQLCTLSEYCPNGKGQPPTDGIQNGDVWAAIGDLRGEFASIGNALPERLCGTHSQCCGTTPTWGNLGYNNGMDMVSRCCGAVDPAVKALAEQKKMRHRFGALVEDNGPYTVAQLPDYKNVVEQMKYYKRRQLGQHELERLAKVFPLHEGRYFAQEMDPGGFNNIRQGFEHAVLFAFVSGRTLLTIPPTPWYLLDFGPKSRQDNLKKSQTEFADIFDMGDLCGAAGDPSPLKCLTPPQFLTTDAGRKLSSRSSEDILTKPNPSYDEWVKALFHGADGRWPVHDAGRELLAWPSIAALKTSNRLPSSNVQAGRQLVELSEELRQAPVLHARITQEDRHLGQIAAAGVFDSDEHYRLIHRFFHDRVHFRPEIFDVAAKVVSFIGIFNYTSMHIRRGDLQYQEVKLPPSHIQKNLRALLSDSKPIYVATDEMQADFLDSFEEGGRTVYRWDDFFTDKGGNVLRGIKINPKHVGMIEQLILASGQRFIGTPMSTFSALVPRLAGYIGAPDTHLYSITKEYEHPLESRPAVKGKDIFTEYHEFYAEI